MDALDLAGISLSYGSRSVLRGVDLRIASGEVVALLGANGAGKTTLLSVVAGLRVPDAGLVQLFGGPAPPVPARSKLLCFATQDVGLYPLLTVSQNLRFAARLLGLRHARSRVDELAERLGFVDLLNRKVATLSGGQQRRVHIAYAVIGEPPLVMLDEPSAGADPELRRRILDFVTELATGGTAVLYSTHYLPEVEALGATVAVLADGIVRHLAPVTELVERYGRTAVEVVALGWTPEVIPRGWIHSIAGDGHVFTAGQTGLSLAAFFAELAPAPPPTAVVRSEAASLDGAFLSLAGSGDTAQ